MDGYTVKKLAEMAGVSVRTLHHYDETGLLKPADRTDAGYRLYGEDELLRLQQILYYKELDFPLKKISKILESPNFDKVDALRQHKVALKKRRERLDTLLSTIDKTISKIKENTIMTYEELYEGFPKEKAEAYRNEAIDKWGDAVYQSEEHLKDLGKDKFQELQQNFAECWQKLAEMSDGDPESPEVQQEIDRHYHYILEFWGETESAENLQQRYVGLGELYKSSRNGRISEQGDAVLCRAESEIKRQVNSKE